MAFSKELKNLAAIDANVISDEQLARLLSGAPPRRASSRSKAVVEAPKAAPPKKAPAPRKRKAPTTPKPKAKVKLPEKVAVPTVAPPVPIDNGDLSSISSLSPPPEDLEFEDDGLDNEPEYTPSVKRLKKTGSAVKAERLRQSSTVVPARSSARVKVRSTSETVVQQNPISPSIDEAGQNARLLLTYGSNPASATPSPINESFQTLVQQSPTHRSDQNTRLSQIYGTNPTPSPIDKPFQAAVHEEPAAEIDDEVEPELDTEVDDLDNEPEYLPSPVSHSKHKLRKPRQWKAAKSRNSPNSAAPKTPFLNRSLKLSILASTSRGNLAILQIHGLFDIAPLPSYGVEGSAEEAQVDSPVQLPTPSSVTRHPPQTSGNEISSPSPQNLPNLRQIVAIPRPEAPVALSPQILADLRQFGVSQELQIAAGLDPVNGRELEKKSHALMQLAKNKQKPKSEGKPEVWADSRQILCETLPYYRAHHGAGYARKGIAYSFMFDAQASDRDYMDTNVIISRAGGGMEKDEESGEMVQSKDTKETHIVKAFRNGIVYKQPVCIITGSKNPTAQFEVPHKYCVLDWFKPAQVWAEKSGDRRIIRYRFEILDSTKHAWWKAQGVEEPVKLGELPPPHVNLCSQCQQWSQQVYLNGWMCTNYDCPALWKYVDGSEPDDKALVYDPRFLKQKTNWPHVSPPQPTKPNPWILGDGSGRFDHGMVYEATKAIVCPNCNRCGARDQWMYWQCVNCHTRYELPRSIVKPDLLHDWESPIDAGFAYSKDSCDDSVKLTVSFIGNYRVHVYTIPGIDGFVAHMVSNKTVNEEKDGPDDMFLELQKIDIGLKRASMKSGEEGLTNQFTKNFGMPYKFIAAVDSSSLDEAPKAIQSSRARLNWSARTLLGEKGETLDKEFNEVLALAYMQSNKINYHDDGEFGLGPTIATLSLGYPAEMKLRMKQKHYRGCTDKRFVDRPPLPGCLKYEERLAAYNSLQSLDKKNPAYRQRLSDLPKELGLHDRTRIDPVTGKTVKANSEADAVISLNLCHGGVVIMHGAAIQEYYEHAVTPSGKLRFALTCRYIDIDSLKEHEKPKWEVGNEKEPYDGFKLPAPGQ